MRTDPPPTKQRNSLHRPARNLQILRPERIDPERSHDQRPELRQRRVRDLRPRGHDEQDPRLRIAQRLPRLVGFEMVVLDALSVGGHAFGGRCALVFGEEFGCGGEVWEEEKAEEAGGYA